MTKSQVRDSTYQSAEPLRWISTRDSVRIHLDPHVVLHGRGTGLACVMFPHRALVRAHQRLAHVVLAEGGGPAVQQQQQQQQQQRSPEEHGRPGEWRMEQGPAQGEGATRLRGEVTRMEGWSQGEREHPDHRATFKRTRLLAFDWDPSGERRQVDMQLSVTDKHWRPPGRNERERQR